MGVYDGFKATATRLIDKFGERVVFRTIRDGTPPDSTKPWVPGAAVTTDRNVTVAFFPDKLANRFAAQLGMSRMNQTDHMPEGYMVGFMAPVSFDPNLKDLVIRDGKPLTIDKLEVIKPNDERPTLYMFKFKK